MGRNHFHFLACLPLDYVAHADYFLAFDQPDTILHMMFCDIGQWRRKVVSDSLAVAVEKERHVS